MTSGFGLRIKRRNGLVTLSRNSRHSCHASRSCTSRESCASVSIAARSWLARGLPAPFEAPAPSNKTFISGTVNRSSDPCYSQHTGFWFVQRSCRTVSNTRLLAESVNRAARAGATGATRVNLVRFGHGPMPLDWRKARRSSVLTACPTTSCVWLRRKSNTSPRSWA